MIAHPPVPSEHQEQAAFFTTILYKYQHDQRFARPLFFAIPNGAWLGGRRPQNVMEKMKAEGLTPGVSDILYLQPRGPYSYLVLEFKRSDQRNRKNGGLRDEQRVFLNAVSLAGAFFAVCYSADEAERAFDAYMELDNRSQKL